MYRSLGALWEGLSKNATEILSGPSVTSAAGAAAFAFGWTLLLSWPAIFIAALAESLAGRYWWRCSRPARLGRGRRHPVRDRAAFSYPGRLRPDLRAATAPSRVLPVMACWSASMGGSRGKKELISWPRPPAEAP